MTSAARPRQKDRHYDRLVEGSSKLQRDIAELETAYLLHTHYAADPATSRKGNESSRWKHGGAGKLTTYKSSRDLVDNDKTQQNVHNRGPIPNDEAHVGTNLELIGSDVNQDRLTDLKTKVLKKASSKVIRRESWAGEIKSRTEHNDRKEDVPLVTKVVDAPRQPTSDEPADSAKRKISVKKDRNDLANRVKNETIKLDSVREGKSVNRVKSGSNHKTDVHRKSRIDEFDSSRNLKGANSNVASKKGDQLVNKQNTQSKNLTGKVSPNTIGVTYTPNEFSECIREVDSEQKNPNAGVFETQLKEPSEIYIDPKSGQVKIGSGSKYNGRSLDLEGTRVLIERVSVDKSLDGQKLSCAVIDSNHDTSSNIPVRDVFGFSDFNGHCDINNGIKDRYNSNNSPFASAKQCNTEVEFWLRGLGVPDVEKYVQIFAENGLDLLDLEFMSASQLHEMGITAFGVLDRILKGIQYLKTQPAHVSEQHAERKKHLNVDSVKWESTDDSVEIRNSITKSKKSSASKALSDNSCHKNQTFVKRSAENFKTDLGNEPLRSSSRMSNVSSSVEISVQRRVSTPSLFQSQLSSQDSMGNVRASTPSFAASTRSSSAKFIEKKPPSAKPASKPGQNVNKPTSQVNKPNNQGGLKRSNSFASERSSRANLESKPTRGVLLRPRSASLTREPAKVNKETIVKKTEGKKEVRTIRARSRSADAVKRKALEGVQAAAKRYEEKSVRSQGQGESLAPQGDRLKQRRDKMAARHLQREREKDQSFGRGESEGDESPRSEVIHSHRDNGLESLVTVNIMSTPDNSVCSESRALPTVIYVLPPINPRGGSLVSAQNRTQVLASRTEVHRSHRREARKSLGSDMQANIERPLLSTYKLGTSERDRSHSEPESGYRTDTSATYSQIEDRVSSIQTKIKQLKARAGSGDEMTLTLVRGLQEQLQHFERQLIERDRRRPGSKSDNENERVMSARSSHASARSQNSTLKSLLDEYLQSPEGTPRQDASPGLYGGGEYGQGLSHTEGGGVRQSRRDLMEEMRREKHQHHRQIRQLETELERIRQTDPLTSLEVDSNDISYREEDKLGEGTFSRVYKGEYQRSEVAIKQLKSALKAHDRNYFAAEVSLMKEVRHPRVVMLMGVCTSGKLPMMVLEHMSGGSLYNHLHNPECESLDHALFYQIAKDMASGVNYLHSHRPEVLHLDLKSGNVLLCQGLRAKIADFGFSKLRHDAGMKSGRRGKSRPTGGAPVWMSPELIDKGRLSCKADVYSFAIILWEMLTRKTPYEGASVFQVLEMVRKNKRPVIPAATPEGLQHLISLCWDQNPAKRPQFKEILQILENLAFPPAWRKLFQKAGVPDSALQDIQSTRTIIRLVTGTLDKPSAAVFNSFMVGQNADDRQFNHSKEVHRKQSSGRSESHSASARSKGASRGGETSDSDTVTSVSQQLSSDESEFTPKSEFTLKNLRESSSEERESSDSSDSSYEDSVILNSAYRTNKPKQTLNVVIPNLELSLQSAREKFKVERHRISQESDWTSISMDSKSFRSNQSSQNFTNKEISNTNMDTQIRLSSAVSTRSSVSEGPSGEDLEIAQVNESARSRRREKVKDLTLYSEDYLRRESFDNRRPPSPHKKLSLSQKLMESSSGRPAIVQGAVKSEDISKSTVRPRLSSVSKSCVELKTYPTTPKTKDTNTAFVRKSTELDLAQSFTKVSLGAKRSSIADNTMRVEDLENDQAGRLSGRVSSRSNTSTKESERDILQLEKDSTHGKPFVVDGNISSRQKLTESDIAKAEEDHKAYRDGMESKAQPKRTAVSRKSVSPRKRNSYLKTDNDSFKRESIDLQKKINEETSRLRDQTDVSEDKYEVHENLKEEKDATEIEPDNIRVVLRNMEKPSDIISNNENNDKYQLENNIEVNKVSEKNKTRDDLNEDIRVKLSMEEVEMKKKPSITPRRSKFVSKAESRAVDNVLQKSENKRDSIETPTLNSADREQSHENMETIHAHTSASIKQKSNSCDTPKSISKENMDHQQKPNKRTESIPSPKKATRRVKLRKDPLALTNETMPAEKSLQSSHLVASPVPPPPPPPPPIRESASGPIAIVSKSVQAPRSSMADELKSRLASRESISEGVILDLLDQNKTHGRASKVVRKQPLTSKSLHIPKPNTSLRQEDQLGEINEMSETLTPQQSEGLPSFVLQSLELKGQKDQLRSISKPHPHQLDDLSGASQEQLSSIAEILRKAVLNRRLAMGEDGDSVSQSMESAATGWSIDA